MIRKTLWYAFLVLLCCSLGALVVYATTGSGLGQKAPVSKTELKAQPKAQALIQRYSENVRSDKPVVAPNASLSTSNVGGVAEPRVEAFEKAAVEEIMAPEVADKIAATEAYDRFLAGYAVTASEKELMTRFGFGTSGHASSSPLDNVGGPDLFGYVFADNVAPDTATYEWIELCGQTGVVNGPTGDDGTQALTISFPFPFFGTNYTTVYVSTNGLLNFNVANNAWTNVCIDGITPTNPFIAPFWVDQYSNTTTGGCTGLGAPWILTKDFGTYYVVEWKQNPNYDTRTNLMSYQAILFPDGRIKFQYSEGFASPQPEGTVGIDHPTAGNGLQYMCQTTNNSRIVDGRAIWFFTPPPASHNFACTAIDAPLMITAHTPGQVIPVTASFRNVSLTEEAAPVKYQFHTDPVVSEMTAVLAGNATETHTFATSITAPMTPGLYTLTVWCDLATDDMRSNDTVRTIVRVPDCYDLDIGSGSPIDITGLATCNFGDDFNATCMDLYDGGEDIVLRWTVTVEGDYDIMMNAGSTTWTGIAIDDACPLGAVGECIAINNLAGSGVHGITGVHLLPGVYYIMVDTYPAPNCIPAFDLSISAFVPPTADFVVTAPGTWTGTTCGAADDCANRAGEEHIYEVTIPNDGNWSFGLCNSATYWDSYLTLTSAVCGGTILGSADGGCTNSQARIACLALTAGTYYLQVEGYSASYCGDYVLDIAECLPCVVTCPPEAIAEGEPNVVDEYVDNYNGGCNSTPNVFSPIACGQTVCGTAGDYLVAGVQNRDTDWYQFTLLEPMTVTWTATAEFPVSLILLSGNCTALVAEASASGDSCAVVTTTANLYTGTYYAFIAPTVTAGIAGDRNYFATLTCAPWTPPLGRCCYGSPMTPLCAQVNEFECASALYEGNWTEGLDCSTPCPPCVDATLIPPAQYIGTTVGAVDNCDLRPGRELTFAVDVTDLNQIYTFSLCGTATNWDTYMFLTAECCGPYLAYNDDACNNLSEIADVQFLVAGTYYVTIEPYYADSTGAFTLDITMTPPPTGRCCYFENPTSPTCEPNLTYVECLALSGSWTEAVDCTTPCPTYLPCPDGSEFGQAPTRGDGSWNFLTSDLGAGYLIYEAFSGVTNPINYLRFWGTNLYHDGTSWVACTEALMPFNVKFYADNAGMPGTEVATYSVVPNGSVIDSYSGYPVYQYDLLLDTDVNMTDGWVSIEGAGEATCWFLWLNSPFGDADIVRWSNELAAFEHVAENVSVCLSNFSCAPLADVTTYLVNGDPAHVWVKFTAPAAGDYKIYSSTVKNNDGDPTGGDPNFVLEATVTAVAGATTWTDPAALSAYKNYVVTRVCQSPVPTGRCCYGDPNNPSCAVTSASECSVLSGTWTFNLDCNTPCPLPTYCEASTSYTGCDEYIQDVTVGDISNLLTGCIGGTNYADYTAMSTNMTIGTGYPISVTNGHPYTADYCGVWVDWNQDLDFEDVGEEVTMAVNPGVGPYAGTITPPVGATLGATRMRVRINYSTAAVPCGVGAYGEIEDYTIVVQ